MVLASLYECSIVKVEPFIFLLFLLLATIAVLEMVMCVSLFVLNEFEEVCITYKASGKQFSSTESGQR